MAKRREITHNKVFYQRNIDLGIEPECHECTSHTVSSNGYVRVVRDSKEHNLHRYIYMQSTGEDPPVVMHLCDNRKCINLNHLEAGSHSDNMKDMILKERGIQPKLKGEFHPSSKLTKKEVAEVRRLLKTGKSQLEISRKFNVCRQTISSIKLNKIWRKEK